MVVLLSSIFLWNSRHHYSAALLWIAALGGGLLNSALKVAFDRARPDVFPWRTPHAGLASFPSGHSMSAMVVYGTLAFLVARLAPTRFLRWLTWAVAATVILLIGLSRVYLGVHYPSDVVAGFLVGGIWAIACGMGIEAVRYFRGRRPEVAAEEEDLGPGPTERRTTVAAARDPRARGPGVRAQRQRTSAGVRRRRTRTRRGARRRSATMRGRRALRGFRGATLLAVAVTSFLLLMADPAGEAQTAPDTLPDTVAIIEPVSVEEIRAAEEEAPPGAGAGGRRRGGDEHAAGDRHHLRGFPPAPPDRAARLRRGGTAGAAAPPGPAAGPGLVRARRRLHGADRHRHLAGGDGGGLRGHRRRHPGAPGLAGSDRPGPLLGAPGADRELHRLAAELVPRLLPGGGPDRGGRGVRRRVPHRPPHHHRLGVRRGRPPAGRGGRRAAHRPPHHLPQQRGADRDGGELHPRLPVRLGRDHLPARARGGPALLDGGGAPGGVRRDRRGDAGPGARLRRHPRRGGAGAGGSRRAAGVRRHRRLVERPHRALPGGCPRAPAVEERADGAAFGGDGEAGAPGADHHRLPAPGGDARAAGGDGRRRTGAPAPEDGQG
jgi:hypothetical protein